MKIAVLREGTHSYNALSVLLDLGEGSGFSPCFCDDNADIYTAVISGHADYGIVAVGNNKTGTVSGPLNELCQAPFANEGHTGIVILAEVWTSIEHALIGNEDAELEDIKFVHSHDQGIVQCMPTLRQHLPNAKRIRSDSTAAAAHDIKGKKDRAALAHRRVVTEGSGLKVLIDHMEPRGNETRFLLFAPAISIDPTPRAFKTQPDRTKSVFVVDLHDRPATLLACLNLMKRFQLKYIMPVPHPSDDSKILFWIELQEWDRSLLQSFPQKVRKMILRLSKASFVSSIHDLGTFPVFRILG